MVICRCSMSWCCAPVICAVPVLGTAWARFLWIHVDLGGLSVREQRTENREDHRDGMMDYLFKTKILLTHTLHFIQEQNN